MNKVTLVSLFLFISSLNAESVIPIESLIDTTAPKTEQFQQIINVLNYIREENQGAADKINDLIDKTDIAFEEQNVSSFIDIIIQALIYIASRFKNYEDNFVDYVRDLKKVSELKIVEESIN